METMDRIALLDSLLIFNEHAGLQEGEVAGLVEFLAGLPDGIREDILEYIRTGDHAESFARFAKLANMEQGQREKILKALGLHLVEKKGFLAEMLGPISESRDMAKQTIDEITTMRQTVQESFLEPLTRLFGIGKTEKK